ncbi:hypothetical protein DXG01_007929 [Tephrocybe rancida]|nr:hypothetical protein DXG01_007929 [Tephrocybe rancida]
MHSVRRSSSDETRPLLEEAPPSYCATDDVDDTASEPPPDDQAMSKFSRGDSIWILAGLWSGVLLGAFDGTVVATLLTPIGKNSAAYTRGWQTCKVFHASGRQQYDSISSSSLYGLGAGLGGPLGGWVNDLFGWRAAFYMQAPLLLFSIVVVATKVNIPLPLAVRQQSLSEKLQRIDVLGSATLATTVGCLLLGFSIKTAEELPWSHPLIYGLLIASLVFGTLFVQVEKHWAPYPVMPLRLMTQRTPLAVSISNLLTSMSAFSTAAYLRAGASLERSEDHAILILMQDHAENWKAIRLDFGIVRLDRLREHSYRSLERKLVALAPAMIAGVYKEDMAVATGITYLFRTTGQVVGVSLSGAVLQAVLLQKLRLRIQGPGSSEASRMF